MGTRRAVLLTDEAHRLLHLERQLRARGIPAGGPGEASAATFKRDIRKLRDELGAVIVWRGEVYQLANPDWAGVMPHLIAEAAR